MLIAKEVSHFTLINFLDSSAITVFLGVITKVTDVDPKIYTPAFSEVFIIRFPSHSHSRKAKSGIKIKSPVLSQPKTARPSYNLLAPRYPIPRWSRGNVPDRYQDPILDYPASVNGSLTMPRGLLTRVDFGRPRYKTV